MVDTGTRVTLFFNCDTDLLFFVEVGLRFLSSGGHRRVLTFPSGFLGELDLDLGMRLLLGFDCGFLVGGREDADGNRDAGFKVQIGDLTAQEGSPRLRCQEESSCSSFEKAKEKKGIAGERRCGYSRFLLKIVLAVRAE